MAKKSRKPNLPQETLERARREMARRGLDTATPAPQPQAASAESPAAPTPAPRPRSVLPEVDLRAEYTYVISDLQNMGMLAAALFIVLVIMSFFI